MIKYPKKISIPVGLAAGDVIIDNYGTRHVIENRPCYTTPYYENGAVFCAGLHTFERRGISFFDSDRYAVRIERKSRPKRKTSPLTEHNRTSMKPCEEACPKCGSSDAYRQFFPKGGRIEDPSETITSQLEYVTFRVYNAKQDVMFHHCRTCQYEWLGKPPDKS